MDLPVLNDDELPRQGWQVERLWQSLQATWPGITLEVVAEIGSTNTALLDRIRAGDTGPALLVAEHQTAGRGRLGRVWHALAGDPVEGAVLTFSLALPLQRSDWSGLSLAVGLALAEALHPALRIKWPNDLWWVPPGAAPTQGRKLSGVLIEALPAPAGQPRVAVIGIGLNLRPASTATDPAQRVCLAELPPGPVPPNPGAVLAAVAPAVLKTVAAFDTHGFAPWQAAYAQRDLLLGHAVRTHGALTLEGKADGVDGDGVLWLRDAQGQRHAVHSGEVSVRPC